MLVMFMVAASTVTSGYSRAIAIPSYFDPGPLWTKMEQACPAVGIAIINPSNGPGGARDSGYADQVNNSQAAGLTVLGYVPTGYGTRDVSVVKTDVDDYYLRYGVDGIFFDEASIDCSHASSYYADLYHHVKAKGGKALTVLNPGTQTNECYMTVADTIVTFEGSYSTYSGTYAVPGWVNDYPPKRFWHLVYAAPSVREMEKAVRLSERRGAGWVYVTPNGLPNPWSSLPPSSYWGKELSAVMSTT